MANKRISELPDATLPIAAGVKFEAVQGGVNVKVDADDMPGSGGGGSWGSITGTLSSQTDLYGYLRGTRTVTSASASVQSDDNALIIFNSASPFNFTLDQITAASKISLLNIGAGAVTLVAGSGVTITGPTVVDGAVGTDYPTAVVFYHTATTPRVIMGGNPNLTLESTDTTGATITLDFEDMIERMFVGSASFGSAKAIALDNDANALVMQMTFTITNVAAVLTFPSTFTMQNTDSRWNDTDHEFTPGTTGKHEFCATWDGTDWKLTVSNAWS